MNLEIKYKLFTEPFPHLIYEDFLTDESQKKILDEILEVEKVNSVNKVMGGRFQYHVKFFKKKSFSKKLFDFFNSKETFNVIKEKLLPEPHLTGFYLEKNKFTNIVKKEYFFYKILKKIFPFFIKNNFFLHMDFSVAKNEYFREPHHDKDSRIISFLLYLNTTNNNEGGSLEIYKYVNEKENDYKRFPNFQNIQLDKKIKPKGGKLIVFLSSPNSIHGVEKFKPRDNEKRIFAYGSYTSFFNVNWIKK